MMGRRKAAVLPLPVMAQASTSRPARAGGMASRWIGVGVREAEGLDGAQEGGVEIQGSEGHGDSTSVERASRRARNRATVCPA